MAETLSTNTQAHDVTLTDSSKPARIVARRRRRRPLMAGDSVPEVIELIDPTARYAEGGWRYPHLHPAAVKVNIVDAAKGLVRFAEPRQKLAIVGFANTTRDEAPYDDKSWVVAGLNQLYRYLPRADIWFETHNRDMFVNDQVRGTDYVDWLRQAPFPVLMEPDDFDRGLLRDIPNAVRFPIEAANELSGKVYRPGREEPEPLDYWESTVAYMVQWGVLMGFKEIGIWGVDMIVQEEYGYQKPNLEFYMGLAMGRGIKLVLPEKSALLRQSPYRYGRRDPLSESPFNLTFFQKCIEGAHKQREEALTRLNNIDGSLVTMTNMYDAALIYARGGVPRGMEKK